MAVLGAVEPLPNSDGVSRTSLQALLGGCLTRAGRMNEALAFLFPPSGASVRQGATVLSEPWSPFADHAFTLIGLGRLDEAEELLAAAQDEVTAHEGSQESAIVAACLGALRLEQGRVQSAFLQATSAASVFLDLSLPVSARWCKSMSASALALAGGAPKATQTLAALDALDLPIDMRYEVDVLQARAWPGLPAATWARRARHWRVPSRWESRRETYSAPRKRYTDWLVWAGHARSSRTWRRWRGAWTAD